MPYLSNYRIFISHAWKYNSDYYKLIEFLNAANNFRFSNYSVPQHDSFGRMSIQELKNEIQGQIRPVNSVIILGGMYAAHSEWIKFEIDFAKSIGKPIVGVCPWAAERMPQFVQESSRVVVGWNTDTIVKAIREHSI